ncbi:MAG: hypothetical protein ABSB35_13175 [Bryobacteraceae bacterium]|jgi:hypothetical protein
MRRFRYNSQSVLISALVGLAGLPLISLLLHGCKSTLAHDTPSIEFTRVPSAGEGDPEAVETIEGRVKGARPDQQIVLFARSGVWWVEPLVTAPFTPIQDSKWKNVTHPGSAYAALLVDSRYRPPEKLATLPEKGGPVAAVATVEGGAPRVPLKTLQFSGYQWEIRGIEGDHGTGRSFYDPANAWTDQNGYLHLRIVKAAERWSIAQVQLSRSLGYGSYRFVVRDVSQLEPATVFALFTWDNFGPPREMDIEISRWGEPRDQNAQYVIQPYVVPANTMRFTAPGGTLTYQIDWQAGQAAFKTFRGSSSNVGKDVVAEHVFTSGVPSLGNERIHMNLYVFENPRNPMQKGAEVIIEKFEFLP